MIDLARSRLSAFCLPGVPFLPAVACLLLPMVPLAQRWLSLLYVLQTLCLITQVDMPNINRFSQITAFFTQDYYSLCRNVKCMAG